MAFIFIYLVTSLITFMTMKTFFMIFISFKMFFLLAQIFFIYLLIQDNLMKMMLYMLNFEQI